MRPRTYQRRRDAPTKKACLELRRIYVRTGVKVRQGSDLNYFWDVFFSFIVKVKIDFWFIIVVELATFKSSLIAQHIFL